MIPTFFLLAGVWASSTEQPGTEPWAPVKTDLGIYEPQLVRGFCLAPYIASGSVTSVKGFIEPTSRKGRPLVASHVYLTVEDVVRQPSRSSPLEGKELHVAMSGGTYGEVVTPSGAGMAIPAMGLRYLFAYTPLPADGGYAKKGDPAVLSFLYLDPDLEPKSSEIDGIKNKFVTWLEDNCV